jgi:hypothetical protein
MRRAGYETSARRAAAAASAPTPRQEAHLQTEREPKA